MTIPYPTGPREVVFSSSGDRTRAADAATVASGSSIASRATALAESLFATLFPADCRFCGAPLLSISRLPVCGNCLDTIRPIAGGVCAICGERLVGPHAFTGSGSEPLCGLCRRIDQVFAKASAYGSYAGSLRDLIHLLKYQQVRPAANLLGRMLAEVIAALEPHFRDASLIVIPVPLHATKQRQRGFNQSELIAQAALKLSFKRLAPRAAHGERRLSGSQAGRSLGTRDPPGRRRFHHGHDGFRVRACFASRRRYPGLGGYRGAHVQGRHTVRSLGAGDGFCHEHGGSWIISIEAGYVREDR